PPATRPTLNPFAYPRIKASSGVHLGADLFDAVYVFRLSQLADCKLRVGPSQSHNADGTATDAAYLEKLATDTNWFFVTRGASVETRTPTGLAADTNWHKVRIRRIDAGTLGFTLDAGTEILVTATLPAA